MSNSLEMFKNTYQSGLLSIFYSCGSDPLSIWDTQVSNGHIKRITDKEVNSLVLEIVGTNVSTTYITCPKRKENLGIRLPFLVMIVKNLKKYFTFEITILDDRNMRRRFRISNFQSTTKIKPFCTTMPIGLSGGWNQVQFNLADFTRRAYGSQFLEAYRVQIHANARLRRIYFCDRLYTEDELPNEYKLFVPLTKTERKQIEVKKEEAKPITEAPPGVKKVVPKKVVKPELEKVSPTPLTEVGEEIQDNLSDLPLESEKSEEKGLINEVQYEKHSEEPVIGEFKELQGEEITEGNVTVSGGSATLEPNDADVMEFKEQDSQSNNSENIKLSADSEVLEADPEPI